MDWQDGWDHMPHDILVAVVRCAGPKEARAMHMVCKSWHTAVRCGLTELTPRAKRCCFERIRCFFPRVSAMLTPIMTQPQHVAPRPAVVAVSGPHDSINLCAAAHLSMAWIHFPKMPASSAWSSMVRAQPCTSEPLPRLLHSASRPLPAE